MILGLVERNNMSEAQRLQKEVQDAYPKYQEEHKAHTESISNYNTKRQDL